jgi:hypothetical protein
MHRGTLSGVPRYPACLDFSACSWACSQSSPLLAGTDLGDPPAHIDNTRRIFAVVLNGRWFAR